MIRNILQKMSQRKSVIVVCSDSAKVAAQISTTTNVPVSQVNREELKVDWEKCFICQTEKRETLPNSSEAQSGDPAKAYSDLGERILKFESLNLLPVPLNLDELSGGTALGTSLLNHKAKFHKTCKFKFGNKKLEKAIKRHEKQEKYEEQSSSKGKSASCTNIVE